MLQGILLPAAGLCEPSDNLPQSEETLVDVNRFLLGEACRTSHTRPLRACQVNQLQLRHYLIVDRCVVRDLEYQREDAVTTTGGVIQIMGRDDFVLDTLVVQLDCMFSVITSEYEKVFYSKLFLLAPSDFESCLLQFATAF